MDRILVFIGLLLARHVSGDAAVPGEPAAVNLYAETGSSLVVEWYPPETDGGSAVTSYTVEWDTDPGVREIQEIRTQTTTGPNEVQTITTSIEPIMEIQTVSTSSTFLPAIQSITTTASPGSALNSEFTLQLDLTSLGGTKELSGVIQHDASEDDMRAVIENLQNVQGPVSVSRSNPDAEGGYTWLVTFQGGVITDVLADGTPLIKHGSIPLLDVDEFALQGTGASIAIDTIRPGNEVSGSFRLGLDGFTTNELAFDASASDVQAALEELPSIGSVDVHREDSPDVQNPGGYVWHVTFTSDVNAGDQSNITAVYEDTLEGEGSTVSVVETRRGLQIGGSFTLSYDSNVSSPLAYDISAVDLRDELARIGTGNVFVTRSEATPQQGYMWTVSFLDSAFGLGDVPNLIVDDSALEGDGASAVVDEIRPGTQQEEQTLRVQFNDNAVSVSDGDLGTLVLEFDGLTTDPITIAHPRSVGGCDGGVIKAALEALSNIGTVSVDCSESTLGVVDYRITFDTNAGNLDPVTCHAGSGTLPPAYSGLSPTISDNVAFQSCASTDMVDGTSETLGGSFTVEFQGQRTGYLSFDVSADGLKTALEQLDTIGTVDVSRSDDDENGGYIWAVTFLTNLGNVPAIVVDERSLTGTVPVVTVHESVVGREPPFNNGPGGLSLGSITYTDIHRSPMTYRIDGLTQGTAYYVRIAALNSIGHGTSLLSTPRYEIPLPQRPGQPVDVTLDVVHSDTLRATWSPPLQNGGFPVDEYLIEWFTSDFVEEEQSVTVSTTIVSEVQVIETHAKTNLREKQVVRTSGSGDGSTATEIQSIACDADSGSFRIAFDGETTEPIAFDADEIDVKAALEALSDVVQTVNVVFTNGQLTVCGPTAEPAEIEFVSVRNYVGDVPQIQTLVASLGGTRRADVTTVREGVASLQGVFTLSFNGDETIPLLHDATAFDVESALNDLESIGPSGVQVSRTALGAAGDYAWTVAFNDEEHLRGDLESIVVEDASSLYGNGARVIVCADNVVDADCPVSLVTQRGNEMRGTFTLSMLGHETAPIEYNAADSTVKRRLEELPNIGTVNVVREQTSPEKTYRWTVTFTSNPGAFPAGSGNMAQLRSNPDDLTTTNGLAGLGDDADLLGTLNVVTTEDGSDPIRGTFMLGYDPSDSCRDQSICDYVYTSPLRVDATSLEVKSALQELSTIGTVDVSRSLNTNGNGYTWGVT
eukprot:g562.t1